jgi:hypothetical protein
MTHEQLTKRRIVRDFIEEHGRSPERQEVAELLLEQQQTRPELDGIGFTGYELSGSMFRANSSAAIENANRQAVFEDLFVAQQSLEDLGSRIENTYRGFLNKSEGLQRQLSSLSSQLDNLILVNAKADMFLYGVEETFDTADKVVLAETNALVAEGYVSLVHESFNGIDPESYKLSVSVSSPDKVLGVHTSDTIDAIKYVDGSVWNYRVFTERLNSEVNCTLQFDFEEPQQINEIKLYGTAFSVNSDMRIVVLYSVDGNNFKSLPRIHNMGRRVTVMSVGLENAKSIRLVFNKIAADSRVGSTDTWVHLFGFDAVVFYGGSYSSEGNILVCGPYEIKDHLGNGINYSKAVLEPCTNTDDNAGISFWLSTDATNWKPADGFNVVSFKDNIGSSSILDVAYPVNGLLSEYAGFEELNFANEAILNSYIDNVISNRNIVLKRNISGGSKVRGQIAGWQYNEYKRLYKTTVYIESIAGYSIDLGSSSLFLNGQLRSGRVTIPHGYHIVEISSINWSTLPSGIASATEFIQKDALYPFNQRYLIEGYDYSNTYVGDRTYQGVEFFESLLTYLTPEEFVTFDFSSGRNYYTLERIGNSLYVKVKVDKSFSDWQNELFDLSWTKSTGSTSNIWVKAVFSASDIVSSPILHSFKIRAV